MKIKNSFTILLLIFSLNTSTFANITCDKVLNDCNQTLSKAQKLNDNLTQQNALLKSRVEELQKQRDLAIKEDKPTNDTILLILGAGLGILLTVATVGILKGF